jgi:DNA-binding NtrC family response regulator
MPANPSDTNQRSRVLVLEDSVPIRALIRTILEDAGYHVWEAGTLSEGEQVMEAMEDGPDMLIADLHIPGTSGFAAVDRLRALKPEMKVLCISGHEIETALPEGTIFMAKPFTFQDLLGAVRRLAGN